MSTILERIVAHKRMEIAAAKQQKSLASLERAVAESPPAGNFATALATPVGLQVIAEIKRASPSAGNLSAVTNVSALAQIYATHGAACISILTDSQFFKGCLKDLTDARQAVQVPLLRKDFILDRYQLLEARAYGADAVLLIAEILDDRQLCSLLQETQQLGMTALVECYEAANLARVVATGAYLIGINNRDLRTFDTSIEHTISLAQQVPSDRCLVSESGITTRADVQRLRAAGVKAILVGETLMRATDIPAKLAELLQ